MPNLFEHFATSAACFRTQCKGTIFLSYYRQLLSTKCIEIVYSFLEKRKSIVVSFDFADKKKNYGKAYRIFENKLDGVIKVAIY